MSDNLRATVDQLGDIRAAIKTLQEKEVALKSVLSEQGVGEYFGDSYMAKVVRSERNNLDMKAVRQKLSAQFIAAHTTTTQIVSVLCEPKRIAPTFINVSGIVADKR